MIKGIYLYQAKKEGVDSPAFRIVRMYQPKGSKTIPKRAEKVESQQSVSLLATWEQIDKQQTKLKEEEIGEIFHDIWT